MTLTISSTAFADHAEMPARCTCEGQDRSPPLSWTGAPAATKSLALIVDDPDAPDPAAPKRTWVHWILYNLPPATQGLPESVEQNDALPPGTCAGKTDFGHTRYGGPCPPIGRHRYFFKLYALDTLLPELDACDKAKLETAMQGHVLAEAQLIGTYQKHR